MTINNKEVSDMEIGRQLDGRYKIVGILGKGGMGTVYLAENIKLKTLWAIKCIPAKTEGDKGLPVETEILKKLDHPALPRIFDVFEEDGKIYIVVDYIEGINLREYLESKGKFSEKEIIPWLIQLCDVLMYLHNQKPNPIIYRDMKPSNIILAKDGKIKLVDFGIAREYKEENQYDTVYIGTRGYAAPEQYGTGQTDARTDIYELGMTIYHLLSGKNPAELPEEIPPLQHYNEEISFELDAIVQKCIRKEPDQRYNSVSELLTDIEKLDMAKLDTAKLDTEDTELMAHKNPMVPSRLKQAGKYFCYKKLILCVIDNVEFASELAYVAANKTNFSVLLMDMNFECQKLAEFFNIKLKSNTDVSEYKKSQKGLLFINEAIENKKISKEIFEKACFRTHDPGRLYLLMHENKNHSLEQSLNLNIEKVLEHAYKYFDLSIAVVNGTIFDPVAHIIQLKSDYVILAPQTNVDSIYHYQNYIEYSQKKYDLPDEKIKYVAYDYKEGISLPLDKAKKSFGKGSYIGKITYQSNREKYRNLYTVYHRNAYKTISEEYLQILEHFNIIPKTSFVSDVAGKLEYVIKKSLGYINRHDRKEKAVK